MFQVSIEGERLINSEDDAVDIFSVASMFMRWNLQQTEGYFEQALPGYSLSLCSKRFRGVWKQRKTEERDFRCIVCAENGARTKKKKEGGGRGEGRKRLQTNPWILKTSVRQRTDLVIGWASPILLTCVDQRYFSTFECQTNGKDTFEACSLTSLTERGFSRQLRQYGRNPVVQCRRFGFSKPAHHCRSKRDTIFSCSFNFNITFLNATRAKDKIINHGTENSHYCVGKRSDFVWLVTWQHVVVRTLTFH